MEPTKISVSRFQGKPPKHKKRIFSEKLEDPTSDDSEWILVSEAAKILGVTRMRIHQLCRETVDDKGTKKVRKLDINPRMSLVSREDIENYKDARGGPDYTKALNRIKKQKAFINNIDPDNNESS